MDLDNLTNLFLLDISPPPTISINNSSVTIRLHASLLCIYLWDFFFPLEVSKVNLQDQYTLSLTLYRSWLIWEIKTLFLNIVMYAGCIDLKAAHLRLYVTNIKS